MIAPLNGSPSPAPESRQTLEQAAQAFEAIFLRNMIGAMRSASIGDDLTGNSGSDTFRDMMDARIAEEMAGTDNGPQTKGPQTQGPQTNGLGIADLLIAQWKDRL